LRAIELLLEQQPQLRRSLAVVQIAVPSRGEVRRLEGRGQIQTLAPYCAAQKRSGGEPNAAALAAPRCRGELRRVLTGSARWLFRPWPGSQEWDQQWAPVGYESPGKRTGGACARASSRR
jgi:hypothetical protein